MGLYSGGGAYIWNEVSVSTCGGLIHGGGGGANIRGTYSRRFTVVCFIVQFGKTSPSHSCNYDRL